MLAKARLLKKATVLRAWRPYKAAGGCGADVLLEADLSEADLIQLVKHLAGANDPVIIRVWTSRKAWQDEDGTTPEFKTDYLLIYVRNGTGRGLYQGCNEIRWMQKVGKYSRKLGTKTKF